MFEGSFCFLGVFQHECYSLVSTSNIKFLISNLQVTGQSLSSLLQTKILDKRLARFLLFAERWCRISFFYPNTAHDTCKTPFARQRRLSTVRCAPLFHLLLPYVM